MFSTVIFQAFCGVSFVPLDHVFQNAQVQSGKLYVYQPTPLLCYSSSHGQLASESSALAVENFLSNTEYCVDRKNFLY
jgi:GR25 family glycosyltransferase involved in LPS biosynthesis